MFHRFAARLTACLALLIVPNRILAQTCADPTRTIHASGASACREYDGQPASCNIAWAVAQNTGQAVSCFYVSSSNTCQGCGPTNQATGACINTCVPASGVPASRASNSALLAFLLLASGGVVVARAQRQPR